MPHSYSTDSAERRIIPFFLAAFAIAAAYLTAHVIEAQGWKIPWWVSPLDTMGYYGLFYWLFDHWIWRTRPMRLLKITRIPCLAGRWEGEVVSSYDLDVGNPTPKKIEVTVSQTWRELSILANTPTSSSYSVSGSVLVNGICSMSYEYVNEPRALAPETMHTHRGTTRVLVKQDGNLLEGEYYSGRDRKNIGTMTLKRLA
jgi:hypothetical protein